jgi:hypothetical protein
VDKIRYRTCPEIILHDGGFHEHRRSGCKLIYIRGIRIYFTIWAKFCIVNTSIMLLSIYKFRKNGQGKGHLFLRVNVTTFTLVP